MPASIFATAALAARQDRGMVGERYAKRAAAAGMSPLCRLAARITGYRPIGIGGVRFAGFGLARGSALRAART